VEEEGATEGKRADAKSVLEVLLLGAPAGAMVDIEATGPDAEAAVDAIAAVLARSSL
jgi:phosphotransferase system HPr (HPr) family protein